MDGAHRWWGWAALSERWDGGGLVPIVRTSHAMLGTPIRMALSRDLGLHFVSPFSPRVLIERVPLALLLTSRPDRTAHYLCQVGSQPSTSRSPPGPGMHTHTCTHAHPPHTCTWTRSRAHPAGMFLVPLLIYKLCPPEITKTPEAPKEAALQLEKMGPMSRDEKYMAGTMAFAVALWVSV